MCASTPALPPFETEEPNLKPNPKARAPEPEQMTSRENTRFTQRRPSSDVNQSHKLMVEIPHFTFTTLPDWLTCNAYVAASILNYRTPKGSSQSALSAIPEKKLHPSLRKRLLRDSYTNLKKQIKFRHWTSCP